MRKVKASMGGLLVCSLPLLAACGPAGATSAEASYSSASAAMSSSASAAMSSASAAMSSASAAIKSSASPSSAAQDVASVPAPTTASAPVAVNFRMPNERGQVLQDAQDAIQANGVFYSRSHDLRGVRHQVLDRDWKVCNQNIPAGKQVTGNAEGLIDFGVVKLSETCP